MSDKNLIDYLTGIEPKVVASETQAYKRAVIRMVLEELDRRNEIKVSE